MAEPWRGRPKGKNSSIVAVWPPQPWQAGESRARVEKPAFLRGYIGPMEGSPGPLRVVPSRTTRKPEFGGFSYVRRRQGRLRPVFRRPAGHLGGVLRRCLEDRPCDQENPWQGRGVGEAGGGHQPVQAKEWIRARYFG